MFEFPPLNFAGVYRQIRFVNAMVRNGYNVVVLTQEIEVLNQSRIDNSILDLVDPLVQVIRLNISLKKQSQNSFISFFNSWKNESGDDFYNAINVEFNQQIDLIIKKNSINLLLCSAPPFSISKLACEKSKKFNLPLILDLRDAWLGWTMVPFPSFDYYLRRRRIERKVLEQATAIISVTNELIKRYQIDHPKINPDKFNLVFNSPNKRFNIKSTFRSEGLDSKSTINIGYSGSFYYSPSTSFQSKIVKPHRFLQYQRKLDDWLYRSPEFFFRILAKLFELFPEYKQKVFFHYIGEVPIWLKKMVFDHSLDENVILHGYLSYGQTKEKESCFDYLLATSEKTLDNRHYCLPSKIFNYLESGKPILAFITEGPQMELIRNINCGVILNPDEILKSLDIIKKVMDEGIELKINADAFNQYSIESTDDLLLNIVDSM